MDSSTKISEDSSEWLIPNSFAEIPTDLDENATSPVTPKSERIPVALGFGTGSGSSNGVTPNHDSDSSYSELDSQDSEAEAFYSSLNHHLVVSPGSHDQLGEKQMSYGELMKKFVQCEEELRTTSLTLQDSEQEIEKLKGETEKKEYAVLLAEDLRVELETARREIVLRNTEVEVEKVRALELERQVVDLETKLSESSFNVENLENELKGRKQGLYILDSEIMKLRKMLSDCQKSFSIEKTKLEADIAALLEDQAFFKARVVEVESHSEILEGHIWQSDAEKNEMKKKEIHLQYEIDALKTDLASRNEQIESLNKDFDKHKLRYDMLYVEKDGAIAQVNNLKAEMRSKDTQIERIKEQFMQLLPKETELPKNTAKELKAIIKELEKQTVLQRNAITEGEEEKREAIRQLCFSLDHYKTGYRELLRFISSKNKQQTANIVV